MSDKDDKKDDKKDDQYQPDKDSETRLIEGKVAKKKSEKNP